MAKGSEQFAWKQFPGIPHVCATCGKTLRVVDVSRNHTSWVTDETRFYCREHIHEGYA